MQHGNIDFTAVSCKEMNLCFKKLVLSFFKLSLMMIRLKMNSWCTVTSLKSYLVALILIESYFHADDVPYLQNDNKKIQLKRYKKYRYK